MKLLSPAQVKRSLCIGLPLEHVLFDHFSQCSCSFTSFVHNAVVYSSIISVVYFPVCTIKKNKSKNVVSILLHCQVPVLQKLIWQMGGKYAAICIGLNLQRKFLKHMGN